MRTVSVNSTCFNALCLLADQERQGGRGVEYCVGGGGREIQGERENLCDFIHCNFVLGDSCHINRGISVHSSYFESLCLSHF
jgi:hypothetical protein